MLRIRPAFPAVYFVILVFTAFSASAAVQGENIFAPVPQGFKLGAESIKGSAVITQYVPRDETAESWTQSLTVEVMHDTPDFNPDTFGEKMAGRWKGACAGGDARKIDSSAENGYPISLWLFSCPENPQTHKPENVWVKAIGGHDAFYSVQYAFRRQLGDDLITPAMNYLRKVMVCDTRASEHPCNR